MLAAVATLSWPCIWDSDTTEMETARFPEVIELLSGNFLYHSSEFYRWRVADRLAILAEDPDNLPARDDLAAALDKLGRAAEAVEVMTHSYELDPDRYETLANLGTFLIHSGDLQKGLEYIELAIAINPDAHFGREIYQRHLVRYLIESAEQGKSILAAAGGEEWSFYHYLENEKRSRTGDRRARLTLEETQAAVRGVAGMMRFGDYAAPVLLGALGDLLMLGRPYATQNAGQLAALAYLRAEAEVGTPEASAAYRRLAEYAMSIHDRSDLEQIEELMHELVAEGAELRAQIAADEERWIEAGLDPEEQFASQVLRRRSERGRLGCSLVHHDGGQPRSKARNLHRSLAATNGGSVQRPRPDGGEGEGRVCLAQARRHRRPIPRPLRSSDDPTARRRGNPR